MRINLTGFTNGQATGKNRKNVIGIANTIKDVLEDNGYIADYGLENPDVNIVSVLDLSSINSSNATNCLKLLRNENCIIMFDDWNIKGFYKGIDKILETKKFSKTHHSVNYEEVLSHLDVIEKLANGEYKVIYPAYKTGNHDLLEIRGEKYCLDPSIYIKKDMPEVEVGPLVPVHASLATKWRDLDKKKYSILNVRNETEDKVFEYYKRHRIVLGPEHYFGYQAGWFRNRYALANIAKAIIIEEDNSCFGSSYAVNRKDVNEKNIDEIYRIQDVAYKSVIMSKEEVGLRLKEIFS